MSFLPIPFAKPDIGLGEEEAVIRVLRSGWLTTGKETLAFEEEFASFCKAPHALAVNSATSGLHLALEAIGIGPGDRVAVPSYTFTASAEVIRYLGADPVFIDCAPGTFHMDPAALQRTLQEGPKEGPGTIKAIMVVHLGGVGWELDAIYQLARDHGVLVIEDGAHSFPAQLGPNAPDRAKELGESMGILGLGGDIGVFSFYANKTITTGEGGMVVCRDPAYASRMKIMRSHGIDREVWQRFSGKAQQWRYAVVEPGFKYNLPDILGALGRVQLGRAMELMENRRRIAARYTEAFQNVPWITLPPHADWSTKHPQAHSWHLYTIQLAPLVSGVTPRDQWVVDLQERGIGTSVHYIPLHAMPYYEKTYNLKAQDFPEAEKAFAGALSIPLWSGLGEPEVQRVIDAIFELGRRDYGT